MILSKLRRPPVLVAVLTAAVIGVVAATVMTASPPPVNTTAADLSRTDQAAGRGLTRTASPTATASPAAKPTPSRTSTPTSTHSQPSGGGTVASSGTCKASFYSEGQHTANGEVFDPNAFTAANKTLPFNTRVQVTNLANGKSVVVRINDRGPFIAGRCLDLSRAAFGTIASLSSGVVSVKYEVLH